MQGGRDKSEQAGLRLHYWLTVVNVSKRAETLWKCSFDLKEHFHKVSSHLIPYRGVVGTVHPMKDPSACFDLSRPPCTDDPLDEIKWDETLRKCSLRSKEHFYKVSALFDTFTMVNQ